MQDKEAPIHKTEWLRCPVCKNKTRDKICENTYTNIDGLDHKILLEADFLVNAGESGYARSAIENFRQRVFRTSAGTELLDSMYLKHKENP